jgi:N-acetyl-gamma-glutamyl-phosphate reductase
LKSAPEIWVIGGTGYTGLEAVRILRGHPFFRLGRILASPGSPARDLGEIDPSYPEGASRAEPWDTALLDRPPAAALIALPDEAAAGLAPALLERGVRVVDLSGAFRIPERSHYPRLCGFEHPSAHLLAEAVYGLTEWEKEGIPAARLLANPGCYPTASLLALRPLQQARLLDPGAAIVVDGKSGVTGAGRRVEAAYLFAEVNENLRPYKVLEHRHVPEMRRGLGLGDDTPLVFAPHLLPISRGLLVTAYVRLRRGVTRSDLHAAYGEAYARATFVRVLGEGRWPELRSVVRTNRCDIGFAVDSGSGAAVVASAIDNLVKGAAGQAVQNLNLMFDRPESEGLAS